MDFSECFENCLYSSYSFQFVFKNTSETELNNHRLKRKITLHRFIILFSTWNVKIQYLPMIWKKIHFIALYCCCSRDYRMARLNTQFWLVLSSAVFLILYCVKCKILILFWIINTRREKFFFLKYKQKFSQFLKDFVLK